jgi:hypothetical protein
MKALLLTGLQRNWLPFIENQTQLLIKDNNFDVFVFTSTENQYRHRDAKNNIIDYESAEPFRNVESLFYDKYINLKDVIIDDGSLFSEFSNNYIKGETKNFHLGLIKSYFKIYKGIEMIEKYEEKEGIKYDEILRVRMDCFLLKPFTLKNIERDAIYFSKSNEGHKDDAGFLVKRERVNILKDFVFKLIENKDQHDNIQVENMLFDHCQCNGLKVYFDENMINRVGCPTRILFKDVPFFKKEFIDSLNSLEYEIKYHE